MKYLIVVIGILFLMSVSLPAHAKETEYVIQNPNTGEYYALIIVEDKTGNWVIMKDKAGNVKSKKQISDEDVLESKSNAALLQSMSPAMRSMTESKEERIKREFLSDCEDTKKCIERLKNFILAGIADWYSYPENTELPKNWDDLKTVVTPTYVFEKMKELNKTEGVIFGMLEHKVDDFDVIISLVTKDDKCYQGTFSNDFEWKNHAECKKFINENAKLAAQ